MPTEEKDLKQKTTLFSRIYGSSASWDDWVRFALHAVSVPMTVAGIYADWHKPVGAIGLSWKTSLLLCVCFALVIQSIVASREKAVARQIVWWVFSSTGMVLMFFASAAFMGSGVWANHQMSQRGRQFGVERIMGEAGQVAPDSLQKVLNGRLEGSAARYVSDTTLAADVLRQSLASNKSAMLSHSFLLDKVRYTVASAKRKAAAVRHSHPQWSAGIEEHAARQLSISTSRRNAADAEARATYSRSVTEADTRSRQRDSTERAALSSSFARFENDEVDRREVFAEAKTLLDSSMWWIVIITSFGSFIVCLLREGYRRFSGKEMDGEAYEPRNNKSKIVSELNGLIEDGFEVVAGRVGDTRTEYKANAAGKGAYKLPSARYVVGSFLFALTAFAFNQVAIFSEADAIEAKMLPTPFGELLLFVCLVALGFFTWHEIKKGKSVSVLSETTPELSEDVEPEPETVPEAVETDGEKEAETVVRQQFQPVPEEDDSTVGIMTPDEIRKTKDRCRKAYERQFTSATRTGQANNTDRYRTEKARLKQAGYKVAAKGPTEKRHVKVEGKPQTVSFNRLIISE